MAYEIPNSSTFSHNTDLSHGEPTWSWPGPGRINEKVRPYLSYMTGEAPYDPSSAQELDLHFIYMDCFIQTDHSAFMEKGPFAATVTIPINTDRDPSSKSTEPPAHKYKETRLQNHVGESFGFSCQRGLHLDRGLRNEEPEILVTPLDDLVLEGGRGTLRVLLSKELEPLLRRCGVDMDDATGRVIIWGWEKESKVFVGDLV